MNLIVSVLFFANAFIIIWAMIGYPMSLKIISRLYKSRKNEKDYSNLPTVTVLVVAHNEERVILQKLYNIIELQYPNEKIEFLIASDNSTDRTNEITQTFIADHIDFNIRLLEVKERKGKTNAQNEAHKNVSTDFLVMTDANAKLERNAVRELMASFTSDEIAYVTGRLSIVNQEASDVSNAESNYWDSDLAIREIESRIQTITAGNGALYACRTREYHDFDPIHSHDSAMPLYYALEGKRAIANHDAIAYEKAGEMLSDEFKRKVRMYRDILDFIFPDYRLVNIFRFKWFSYFYFGHRTCRYSLWIAHLMVFVTNLVLIKNSWFYLLIFFVQVLFYLLSCIGAVLKTKSKYFTLFYYYTATIIAQWVGVYNILTGKAKPFWEKAESTR